MWSELLSIFLLGIINGLTVCSISCMPVLASYLMITGHGFRDGLISALSFVGGKTLSYMILGGAASILGAVFIRSGIPVMGLVDGGLLIVAGISLPFLYSASCHGECGCGIKRMSLFALGLSSGFVPCPSMVAVFLVAAAKGKIIIGAACGVAYGLGLALSPLLILSGAVSSIAEKIKEEAGYFIPVLKVMSAMILVGMGLRVILREV